MTVGSLLDTHDVASFERILLVLVLFALRDDLETSTFDRRVDLPELRKPLRLVRPFGREWPLIRFVLLWHSLRGVHLLVAHLQVQLTSLTEDDHVSVADEFPN